MSYDGWREGTRRTKEVTARSTPTEDVFSFVGLGAMEGTLVRDEERFLLFRLGNAEYDECYGNVSFVRAW